MNVAVSTGSAVPVPTQNQTSAVQNGQQAQVSAATARAEGISAMRTYRQALRIASDANRRAGSAASSVRSKEAKLLDPDASLTPEERAELEAELESARRELAELEQEAVAANTSANEWEQYTQAVEEWRLGLERDANATARAAGKQTPYPAQPSIRDLFVAQHFASRLEELARLLGTPRPQPPERAARYDAQRVAVATEANPGNGAKLLEELLAGAGGEEGYRQTLVLESRTQVAVMGRVLSGLGEGLGVEDGAAREMVIGEALAALVRCAEALGSGRAWPLVEAFSLGVRDGDENPLLGQRLVDAMLAGPNGGLFAAELAAALHGSGKETAAREVLSSLAAALAAARERFVRAAQPADALDARFCRALHGLPPGVRPAQLEEELRLFREENAEIHEEREAAGSVLGSLLNGAGVALAFSKAGALPEGDEAGNVLQEALLSLGHLERVACTRYGQRLLGLGLDAQARGERTYLDMLPDAARVLWAMREREPGLLVEAGLDPDRLIAGGAPFLQGVGLMMAHGLAPQVLALRNADQTARALRLLELALEHNPALFGAGPREAALAYQALTRIIQARAIHDLKEAFAVLGRLDGVALRALGVVVAVSSLPAALPSQATMAVDALRRWARQLLAGTAGLGILCAMLREPVPTPEVARILASVRPGLLDASRAPARLLAGFGVFAPSVEAAGAAFLTELGSLLSRAPDPEMAEALIVTFMLRAQAGAGSIRALQSAA